MNAIFQDEKIESHRYRVDIPNCIFQMKLPPKKFSILVNHFYHGQNLSIKDWKYFEKMGMAEKFQYSEEEILFIIKIKRSQSFPRARQSCDWCSGSTLILHAHHYPTRRCEGGKETVNICANCHSEYHFLSDVKYIFKNEFVCGVIE